MADAIVAEGGLKVGADPGTEVITSARVLQNIASATINGNHTVEGVLRLSDATSAPSAVTGLVLIYVDGADGDLKVRFADGTTKTLATNP